MTANPPRVTWQGIPANGSVSVAIVAVVGNDTDKVMAKAAALAGAFDSEFDRAKTDWQAWWEAAFTPPEQHHHLDLVVANNTSATNGNPQTNWRTATNWRTDTNWWRPNSGGHGSFTGNLPVLTTTDSALARTYYSACVSLLCNAYFGEATGGMAPGLTLFGSAGPISAVTAMYIWDTTLCGVLFALLEPAFLEGFIQRWAVSQSRFDDSSAGLFFFWVQNFNSFGWR